VAPPEASPDRPWLARYPASVPADVEIPPGALPELVAGSARRYPDRTALVYYGSRWTYARFWEESGRFAAALARDGVRPGDRVALYLPNTPIYPIAFFGVLRAGAVVTQVSPLYVRDDLVCLLADAAPKAIVTLEILHPNLAAVAERVSVPITYVGRLRDLYPVPRRWFVNLVLRRRGLPTAMPRGPGIRHWGEAIGAAGAPPALPAFDPATTVAVLQYTGGTTGVPKAAMLTHRNLVANVTQLNTWNTTREPGREVILAALPFFHVYGLTVALLVGLVEGSTVVIQTRPEPGELLRLIDRYRPTQLPGVPALYRALLDRPDLPRYRMRSIKFCMSGSAPLPPDVQRRFEAATGAVVIEGYGLSETSPATHVNPIGGERRLGSIGLPLPSTDQRLTDPEHPERAVPLGEVGELTVRGPQVMLGYYRQPSETVQVLRDGWFLTGDLARLDADGYAYIVDRKKDMIDVGGLKVYPREVEEVLLQHPSVADAAVVGVPDRELGEVPVAFVAPRPGTMPTESELIAYVRSRIAHYKAPRTVAFRTSLPRSGVQKLLRRALRDEAIAARGPAP
jgi:long-chain acyl-CoA synthetase